MQVWRNRNRHSNEKEIRSELRYKVAIRFAIEGDLRFISHHDTMRLFERALVRARLPVRFSAGFNPRPKLSLPLPRAVGVASQVDLLIAQLCEPIEPSCVLDRLAEQMPAGAHLLACWLIEPGKAVQPDQVTYAVDLPAGQVAEVARAVTRLLAAETWIIHRSARGRKPGKTLDLRAYLVEASVEAGTLCWSVRVTNEGSVRPDEMLEAVGLADQARRHRVRRTGVNWKT
jgi:radical SAM-linked protein